MTRLLSQYLRYFTFFIFKGLLYLGLCCALPLPAHAQLGPPDLQVLETLRDDYGWDAAFGWGSGNPCPAAGADWPDVICNNGRVTELQLSCGTDKLTTDFPVELNQLTELTILQITGCWTDPNNPATAKDLTNLSKLNILRLDDNTGLTGTLQDLLGNSMTSFPNFGVIEIKNSGIGGIIPPDMPGNVIQFMHQTRVGGTLPNNVPNVFIYSGNQLEGVLPPDWVNHTGGDRRFDYNKFDVVNTPPGPVDNAQPGWRNTQTVPPTDVQVTPGAANEATLSWTPIGYTGDGGYYEVLASPTPGGTYTPYGTTESAGGKTATGLSVTGLPGGTNYFVVRTFTPAHMSDPIDTDRDNPNDLTSVNSAEVSVFICPGSILYVNDDAMGNDNGTSWDDAFNELQDALALAASCPDVTEIWVAEGTYKPTTGTDRGISFSMVNGIGIYGGFPGLPGQEGDFSVRDWAANETVLSGDIGTPGDNSDNSRRIIYNTGLDNTAILDGFTIRDASNDFSGQGSQGGGMWNNGASPSVRNCTFRNNNVGTQGGGVANNDASPEFINCLFIENSAVAGGAFRTELGSPTLINCTFVGNTAQFGGAINGNVANIFDGPTNHTLINCILWGNGAGNEIRNFTNATIAASNSIIQSGYAPCNNCPGGDGNVDPFFVDAANGDFTLQQCSPAIDAGDNNALPAGITTDLGGNPRFFNNGTVDLGAYEYQSAPEPIPAVPPFTTENGLHFDGIDDYVEILDCPSPPLANGGDAITIEYWFKGTNIQSAVRFQLDNNTYVVAGWNGTHVLSNDGGLNGIPVGAAATDGNWHHVAMTWQRNTANGFKSYLDGQLVAQRTASDNPLPVINTGMNLGAYNGASEFMSGTLDEVRIWNVARTQAEIQAGFCNGVTAPQENLLVHYTFDHGTANGDNTGISTLANSAGSAFTGVLHNFALSGTSSNWTDPHEFTPQTIRYVKAGGTGNGTSWANASGDLQAMIEACGVEQVWVAAGTYKPTSGTDRQASFVMKNGVAIYGGFPNTGDPVFTDRDWVAHETILSGDIGTPGDNSDNSFHVIFNNGNGLDNTAVLDGFTISGGNANGSTPNDNGGGMFNSSSSPMVTNCTIAGNSAYSGGGMLNGFYSSPMLTNCTFFNNSASNGGGMLNLFDTSPKVTNCIFWDNGNEITNWMATPTVTYSIIQGGYSPCTNCPGGDGNVDPLFVDAANGDFTLQQCSPAIDAGDNNALPAGITTDLDGNPRFFNNGMVDLGAYEYQATPDLCLCTDLRTWTGSVSTDWNTDGNWSPACVPTADNPVIIPDVANNPVISAATVALAQSVHVQSGAVLSIQPMASLAINGSASYTSPINFTAGLNNEGTVDNSGELVLGSVSSVGDNGIYNQAVFQNNASGHIHIDRSTSNGILNDQTFTNAGHITIGAVESVGSQGIFNVGQFINSTAGHIHIDRSTLEGITNFGTFTNAAEITIGAHESTGLNGLRNNGNFFNNAGGHIRIDRSTNNGLINDFGTFTNSADITIGANESAGTYGLYNRRAFQNTPDGHIQIDRSTSSEIGNFSGGNFTNAGVINLGAPGSTGAEGINNRATFQNDACAQLFMDAPLSNTASFTNAGLFTVNTIDTHGNSGLTNDGIIVYPQGNPIPNVSNNDLIVGPVAGCESGLSPALGIGSANSFTAGATWYTDEALSTPAGSYNQSSNTFSSSIGAGTHTLYFSVDGTPGCPRTVPITVNLEEAPTPANAGPDQFGVCGTASLSANTPSVGTGQWSILVEADGQGAITDPTSPTSSFTGTPGQTYTLRWSISNGSSCPSSSDNVDIEFQQPLVSVSVDPVSVDEDEAGNLAYTISRDCASAPITVNFSASGTATFNTDYSQTGAATFDGTTGTVFMDAGVSSVTITFGPVADATVEPDERITLTLLNGHGYQLSAGMDTATGTILNDDLLPSLSCPADFSEVTDLDACYSTIALPVPAISDACGGSTLEFRTRTTDASQTPASDWSGWMPSNSSGQAFNAGHHEIEWRVISGSGTATCSYSLEVRDEQPPTARCQNVTVQLAVSGQIEVAAGDITVQSSDNCSIAGATLNGQTSLTFTCEDIGRNVVDVQVQDAVGNTSDCMTTVIVQASDACDEPIISKEGGPSIADPCICSARPGYFDEEVLITSNNPGQAWRILSVSGLVDPNDFPNVFSAGDLFTDNNDGTYSLVGMHASGVVYNIVAVSDFYPGEELMVSNLCYLPALSTANTNLSVCSNEPLGLMLENQPPADPPARYLVDLIDLGDAVQLSGLSEGESSAEADLLADMVFEYTGIGSTEVQIRVTPYNAEDCAGSPVVISVQVENCEIPVRELPLMDLRMLFIYLGLVVSAGLFAGLRIAGRA